MRLAHLKNLAKIEMSAHCSHVSLVRAVNHLTASGLGLLG